MAKNRDWFAQQRARGLCWICRRPMRDDDPHLAHTRCNRLQGQGVRVAEIRAQQQLPLHPESHHGSA